MDVHVLVRARSKHPEGVVSYEDGSFTVYTKVPAVDGKANVRVLELVAAHFRVSKTQVSILRGTRSRQKTIRVAQ